MTSDKIRVPLTDPRIPENIRNLAVMSGLVGREVKTWGRDTGCDRSHVGVEIWVPWDGDVGTVMASAGFSRTTPDPVQAYGDPEMQCWTWYSPVKTGPRTFSLYRDRDVSGVSGTGRVAEGCWFGNGMVSVGWLGPNSSVAVYPRMEVTSSARLPERTSPIVQALSTIYLTWRKAQHEV